jgi:hypothetical protein
VSVLLWWLIPVIATLIALAWVALRNRPSRPADAAQGMAEMERFREAMAKPLPPLRRPADGEGDPSSAGPSATERRSA